MESDTTPPLSKPPEPRFQVALFVTCLADLFRPSVAFASIELLERAGCEIIVPKMQSCCGQPSYNTGDYRATVPIAKMVIENFEPYDYVVAPSGSCAGMICHHYPQLLEGEWRQRALDLSSKTFELTSFLVDIAKADISSNSKSTLSNVTYHDSCAGLRELNIKEQPRKLLKKMCNVEVSELKNSDTCCGFGGTFCAKMPQVSTKMVDDKIDDALQTQAKIIAGGDLGCLLNIAGRATRRGVSLDVRHIAELLVDDLEGPAIGSGVAKEQR